MTISGGFEFLEVVMCGGGFLALIFLFFFFHDIFHASKRVSIAPISCIEIMCESFEKHGCIQRCDNVTRTNNTPTLRNKIRVSLHPFSKAE